MKRRTQASLILTGILALTAASSASDGLKSDTRIVAEIGQHEILVADIVTSLNAARRRDLAQNRLDSFASAATRRTLDQLLDVRRLADAAREAKLADRPDIRRGLDALANEFLAQQMVAEYAAAHAPDEAAVRTYYETHQSEFVQSRRVRARHVVVRTEAEAIAIAGKLKRNADFGEIAAASNIDATKARGGELGWVMRGSMVEPYDAALFALRVGEISPVVHTPYGYHLIQVEEIEAAKPKPFDSVATEVRARLTEAGIDAFKAELAKSRPARIHEDVLKSVR